MTPCVPEEGKLRASGRGLGPPIGVRDLPASVQTSHARRASIPPGRVRRLHVSRKRGRGRGSSTGRLAHPPHLMWVVEARSTAAARVAAFVRSHCRPRITEVHSAAACATSAQSPSAALNGYVGTALFHHAAYAASYTAVQLRCRQRCTLHHGAVSTRQGKARRSEDSHGQTREIRG